MNFLAPTVAVLTTLTIPATGQECPVGKVCVDQQDMQTIVEVLKERKCLDDTQPVLTLQPVVITVDEEGRYYYSGAQPHPYQVKLDWCHYKITGEGQVDVQVAQKVPATWGFRFRPKAHLGYLPARLLVGSSPAGGVEAGLGADFLYWKSWNLGATVGIRGVSVGPGYDITRNFGAWVGYEAAYQYPFHNVVAGIWFAF
jgi:hypothetical protein